jgi:hypothetical protein
VSAAQHAQCSSAFVLAAYAYAAAVAAALCLQEPPFDELAFAKGVTYDATPEAGAAPGCVQTVRRAWEVRLQC